MPDLVYFRLWLWLGMLGVAAVFVVSLISLPPIPGDIHFADKIGHTIAYAIMMHWFCRLYPASGKRLMLGTGFILMGVGLEVLQGMGGVRSYEIPDMLANSLGVVLGALAAILFRFNILQQMDRLLARPGN